MIVRTKENKTFEAKSGQTILEAAINANIVFAYSCKTGQCGICKTTLIQGDVSELNSQVALTRVEKENQKILTCCCIPKTDLLIDSIELSELKNIEVKTYPTRINKLYYHSEDIVEVSLRFPPNTIFNFIEGQFVDITWNGICRSYSLASTKEDSVINFYIKKVKKGRMSKYWFEEAKISDLLRIEGPKGTFFIRDKNKPLVFLATGTGIAPVISMLNKLDQDKTFCQEKPIYLFWGNGKSKDFFMKPEFKKIEVSVTLCLSEKEDGWNGRLGYVQNYASKLIEGNSDFDIYACGSEKMIRDARGLMLSLGVVESSFYSDAFVKNN